MTHMSYQQAALPLDFLVIGGGIGGLAVACSLGQAGHRVRVIEKLNLDAPSGGLRVPPNLSKILRQWFGVEELRKYSCKLAQNHFRAMKTDELVGAVDWKPAVMAETGGEMLVMHREDLMRMLHERAVSFGAEVTFDTLVVSVQQGEGRNPRPSATLSTGEVLTADILIGAEGNKSIVREVVLDEEDHGQPGGMIVYTGVVSGEEMLKDPELAPYLGLKAWTIHMSSNISLCTHNVHGDKDYFFHMYSDWNIDGDKDAEESWEESIPFSRLELDENKFGPIAKRMASLASTVIRTKYMARLGQVDDWIDETGRMVLLGDAAHPAIPAGTHTSALAVEDAVVLGSLFSHLRSRDQIRSFLSAYQELRQQRTSLVLLAEIGNWKMVTMPEGAETALRDENMRQGLRATEAGGDDWDDGILRAQFEEIAEIFAYDAGDAAEEWWVNWGRFSETARDVPRPMSFFGIDSVSHVVEEIEVH